MVADSAIELYEICLPHTYILCSFALFVYPFLLLIRIRTIGKKLFTNSGKKRYNESEVKKDVKQ